MSYLLLFWLVQRTPLNGIFEERLSELEEPGL